MSIRRVARWALGTLALVISTAARSSAAHPLGIPILPEDPTIVLVTLGGVGMAWQYFRSRARK